MFKFLDYFFFRCYCYYLKVNKDGGTPTFWASSILSVVLGLNILVFVYLWGFSTIGTTFKPNKYNVVLCFGIIWFIAFIRYKYFVNFSFLYKKWGIESKIDKKRKGKIILAYLIGSFVLTLGFGILMKQLLK